MRGGEQTPDVTKMWGERHERRWMAAWPGEIPSDEVLLRCIAQSDEVAFDAVYQRHSAAVMSVCYRLLRDRDMAAEVTQQTFLRLWDRASTIDPQQGHLRPWLLLVARNAAVDLRRRQRLGATAFERGAVCDIPERDTAEIVLERLQKGMTRDLLDTLNDEQRLVIELAYFGELTQTQIAKMLALPLGTIKSRLRLGLQHLRAHVRARGWDT